MTGSHINNRSVRWTTQGFEAFRAGIFGNGGQNLYVSRAGVLQRIFHFDITQNGHTDLIFCNSQGHVESPPVYVYRDPLGAADPIELPAKGAWSGAVADLTGNGRDDLIVGNFYDGVDHEINATIYFANEDGWSPRAALPLPAAESSSVAAGDFNGDGRPDLAFITKGKLRLFPQTDLGFEYDHFTDLPVEGRQLAAADLDHDGHADLLVRDTSGQVTIYWGGGDGIDPDRAMIVPVPVDPADTNASDDLAQYEEYRELAAPLVSVIHLNNRPYIFVARNEHVYLVPVAAGRAFADPIVLNCPNAMAIAVGDLCGSGSHDLAVACAGLGPSYIYWDQDGYGETDRTSLPTDFACDVAIADLDSSGQPAVIFAQHGNDQTYTTESLIYKDVTPAAPRPDPIRLTTHDARRVLVGRPTADDQLQLAFINHYARDHRGHLPVTIYTGGADGYHPDRKTELPACGSVDALAIDVNDDGLADLVIANAAENDIRHDVGSFVYLNSLNGFGGEPAQSLPTTRAHGVACGDLNHDGYLDLVFVGIDNPELLIFHGSPHGFDTENPTRIHLTIDNVTYKEGRWPFLADLTGNGYLDLFIPQIDVNRSLLFWGSPEGFSLDRCDLIPVNKAACARAADFTGNGYLDLVIASQKRSPTGPHDAFVYIYWNGTRGLDHANRTVLPAHHANSMSIADYNNDGRLDLFVGSYTDGRVRDLDSYIYWNRPDRYFTELDRTRLFTHSASGSIAGDFNDDGYIDLAIANHKCWGDHKGYSEVWWNGPDGFDPKRTTRLPTTGPHGMTSVEPGNMADRTDEEYYTSPPHCLPDGARITGIHWTADCPVKTWVHAQFRAAESESALDNQPWHGPDGPDTWFTQPADDLQFDQPGPLVQFRLALGAIRSGASPRVQQVDVLWSADPDRA